MNSTPGMVLVPTEARVSAYTLSLLTDLDDAEDFESYMWQIKVEYRAPGRWAVLHGSRCLAEDWSWDYEMNPSSRTDDWLRRHRFTEHEALKRASVALPTVTVNGSTADDYRNVEGGSST